MILRALAALLFLTLFIFYFDLYQHETVHKRIMIYYGCEEAVISYGITSASTACLNRSENYDVYDHSTEYALHSYNEIVGYNLDKIVLTIIFSVLILILFLEHKLLGPVKKSNTKNTNNQANNNNTSSDQINSSKH